MGKEFRAAKSPSAVFFIIVAIISVALASSALHTFFTLRRLRGEFLLNRAIEVATAVNRSVRGPGKWMNASHWQEALIQAQAAQPDTVAFLALADGAGRILTGAGPALPPPGTNLESLQAQLSGQVFVYEHGLLAGRGGPRWESGDRLQGSRLIVGILTDSTDSLLAQARLHVVISALTILTLWVLSYYLLRTTHRFLELKVREESEKHLADLGRLSATLAHEIRNPLGAMKGLSQVIQEQIPANHPAQPMMDTVIEEAGRLEKLVTDLLSFARPSSGASSRFDLAELIRETRDLLRAETEQAGVEISISSSDLPLSVYSDRDGLKQVLINVFRNAIEASPGGGRVTVTTEKSRKIASGLHLSICDQGTGIQSEDPEALFQPFTTTKVRGSGLGLAVSRRILEGIGGRISLVSRDSGGACCSIDLPRRSSQK